MLVAGYIGVEAASILAHTHSDRLRRSFDRSFLDRAARAIVRPGISVSRIADDLWERFDVKMMHDPTEGGISAAIHEVCRHYKAGCVIDARRLRFYPPALRLAQHFGISPLGMISSGCLLVFMGAKEAAAARNHLRRKGIPCEIAGRIVPAAQGIVLVTESGAVPLPEFWTDELARLGEKAIPNR